MWNEQMKTKNSFLFFTKQNMTLLQKLIPSLKKEKKQLTEEQVLDMIEKKEFFKMWVKTTVCLLTLKNWFEIVTSSSCIDPENYNQEIWEHISYRKAVDRIRELEWYESHNSK